MEQLINKITSYHIFNNFFPGILLSTFVAWLFGFSVFDQNPVFLFFAFYFIGMIISRVGSLFLEPIVRRVIKWSKYDKFVKAEKNDSKVSVLLQEANTYRSVSSMVLLSIIAAIVRFFIGKPISTTTMTFTLIALTFTTLLFIFSYYKQCKFINERMDATTRRKTK